MNTNIKAFRRIGKIELLLCLMVIFAHQLNAQEFDENGEKKPFTSILVTNSYMPQVPPTSRTSAVYMSIKNTSNRSKVLEDVTSPNAKHTMIHKSVVFDGTATMNHLSQVVVAPGETIALSPGGIHIMLMGLLIEQNSKNVVITLKFQSGEVIDLEVPIVIRAQN